MSTPTPTQERSAVYAFVSDTGLSRARRSYKKKDDAGHTVSVFEKVPVFRSGTFRDSLGDQMTWTDLHMKQMFDNFNYLSSTGSFGDVPVRKGHGSFFGDPIDGLVGYLTGVTVEEMTSPVDGKKYHYILADYEILDPDAQQKIESGLWRNRSAEIGRFVTNDEAEYWPVFMGFAFVDIPAVEGLHLNGYSKAGKRQDGTEFSIATNKENEVGNTKTTKAAAASDSNDDLDDDPTTPGEPDQKAVAAPGDDTPPAAPTGPPAGAPGTQEIPESPSFDDDDDDDEKPLKQTEDIPPSPAVTPEKSEEDDDDEDDEEPLPVTEGIPGPVFSISGGKVSGHFRIGGKKTRDFGKVQAHIDGLESANEERKKVSRERFCKKLSDSGRILASALDSTTAFAASLNDAQYATWSAQMKSSPVLAPLGTVAQATGDDNRLTVKTDQDNYRTQLEIVKNHTRGGKTVEDLKDYPSVKTMKALAEKVGADWSKDLSELL